MGTHGRRGVRHMFLGSVAEEMLRMSPRPVITIRKGDTNNNIPKHILIPFDFSKHAQKTLLEGCDIAHKVAARLTLLHVIEFATLSAYLSATNEVTLNHIYKTITEDMKNKLYDIVNKSGIGKDCKIEVILGHVASSIIKYASSNKVDLIVMGSLGYSGLTHFLLGSTTEKILRSATCPVMTVKPSK